MTGNQHRCQSTKKGHSYLRSFLSVTDGYEARVKRPSIRGYRTRASVEACPLYYGNQVERKGASMVVLNLRLLGSKHDATLTISMIVLVGLRGFADLESTRKSTEKVTAAKIKR